jgi:hypothetical protein
MKLNVKAPSGSVSVGVACRIAVMIDCDRVIPACCWPVTAYRVAWLTPFSSERKT